MRFEFSVAFKYLIPRWRQLSVSIISLVSVLVISLVVWLVVVFLSVTDGIEKKWIDQLVALNSPIRMVPTEAYYDSYYYQIDSLSGDSNYTNKTIGEKLQAGMSDPYDPMADFELPADFPSPESNPDGSVKDLTKEAWSVLSGFSGLRAEEYEVTFGNLHLELLRDEPTFLTQVSYISTHDSKNSRMAGMIATPSARDFNNMLKNLSGPSGTDSFFENVEVKAVKTTGKGYFLPQTLYPKKGSLKAYGVIDRNGEMKHVVIANTLRPIDNANLLAGEVEFSDGEPTFTADGRTFSHPSLLLESDHRLTAERAQGNDSKFRIETKIQGVLFSGTIPLDHLEIAEAYPIDGGPSPLWIDKRNTLPPSNSSGEGILVSKHFQSNGVLLGDRGYLAYYTPTPSAVQEQRLPIYVAGFYDPGFMPVGNKVVFVNPDLLAMMRGGVAVADQMLGNGINVHLAKVSETEAVKLEIQQALDQKGLSKYWTVLSYADYEFARPVLEQLRSDKNLFTLIAVIILIVACSNIVSMLILLVNDKKKEIGIMQSMGASATKIASIFGICGFLTGLISSIIGTIAAIVTLHNLQALIQFLSFMQGHEAFQAAFYGSALPNELSMGALFFVLMATIVISLLAGIAPAIKAVLVRPSEILRAE
ncbi:MAG: Lipoprotein-releasing system transmembrane protein LolE [Chlamydiae bacterium]|nr:Lipoprotein-releasing system transmembrane protein LolE [Chlamydiota bacterium]